MSAAVKQHSAGVRAAAKHFWNNSERLRSAAFYSASRCLSANKEPWLHESADIIERHTHAGEMERLLGLWSLAHKSGELWVRRSMGERAQWLAKDTTKLLDTLDAEKQGG
jgi:hypothetical protein